MELHSGQSLAHYRLVEKIGEGGMGVVWKADDTKLGRQVAIKILPEHFAQDAERMARFAREAQVLASLNHPNVAAIYGLEEQGSVHGIVLELVGGETLAERIARGPVPVGEALQVAVQIAEAMEAAHSTGTIHRDLKPGNVKITEKGVVKVLDFGLAKALIGDLAASPNSTQSPTITASPTMAGVILGTASYMSPEQARGKPADRRSDVWAFGVILFEMLTGRRLFGGETITDVLAAVVRAEPEWEKLPAETPASARKLLRRCLGKDPARRMRDFGDIVLEIREAGEEPPALEAAAAAGPAPPRSALRRLAGPAGALLLAAAAGLGGWMLAGSSHGDPVINASILPPKGTQFNLELSGPGVPALSPDGRMLVFAAGSASGERLLYVRPLDAGEAYVLTGTDSAQYPFWSPDSRYLGFFTRADGKLKKIPVSGGPPVTLCDAENGKGGTWSAEGIIVFSPGSSTPLFKVRETGGVPSPLTQLDESQGDVSHRHPFFLPDGKHVLFFIHHSGDKAAADAIATVGVDGGGLTHIVDSPVAGIYASGYLLFVRGEVLMAQPFDPARLVLSGEPVPLSDHVGLLRGAYKAVFSASSEGRLSFISKIATNDVLLKRVEKASGRSETLGAEAGIMDLSVSPDGSRAALVIVDPASGNTDIWIHDLARDLRTRFTFEASGEGSPVWSPDGERIYYGSEEAGRNKILVKAVSGIGNADVAVAWEHSLGPESVSPDGKWLVASSNSPETKTDLWVFPLGGGGEPRRIVSSPSVDDDGIISPDGKWMAYMAIESGRHEIYLTSFPEGAGKWQVSDSGGDNPLWSHDARKIVYQDPKGMIVEVPIEVRQGVPAVGRPSPVMASTLHPVWYKYGILPDGSYLLLEDTHKGVTSPVTLILNWPRMLERNAAGR